MKSSNLEASPATGAENPLSMEGQDEKDGRVIVDLVPCVVVTSLETDAFMAIVAYFDILTVRRNPARGPEKEGTQGSVAILKEKIQGCVSQNSDPMNSILTESCRIGIERFGGTHPEILRAHLVRN